MADADLKTLKRPHAVLTWGQGGPVSEISGDVYFSVENGLEETRSVFLAGAGFPERFNDDLTVVGELGFGTGLNFLALAQLFLAEARPDARLHFITIEGWPLRKADAVRALSAFPELASLASELLERWPSPHTGAHRRVLAKGRITLTVFHDEIAAALDQMDFKADAWFLDGFSPAKNADMWTDTVFGHIARLSKCGAPAATFTIAGFVRRGLANAGFAVEKRPGFGRKRERLEALFQGPGHIHNRSGFAASPATRGSVAIIGGGIAAAALVEALGRRGRVPTVFAEGGWASGASGAPLGLLTPRLEAADRPHNRALLAAFDYAAQLYRDRGWLEGQGILRCASDAAGETRLKALAEQLDDRFEWRDADKASSRAGRPVKAGLWIAGAGAFDPCQIVTGLAEGVAAIDVQITEISKHAEGWQLIDSNGVARGPFETLILAGGYAGHGLTEVELEATAGQVGRFETDVPLNAPVAWGGYAAPFGQAEILVGATHIKGPDPGSSEVAESALRKTAHTGPVAIPVGACVQMWGGVRAAVADRLPVCGRTPDSSFEEHWRSTARRGGVHDGSDLGLDGPIMLGALGARGFAHAPLLAEQIVSELCGEPPALERGGIQVLHPARLAWRRLKRAG